MRGRSATPRRSSGWSTRSPTPSTRSSSPAAACAGKIDMGTVAACRMALPQSGGALAGRATPERLRSWRRKRPDGEAAKRAAPGATKAPEGEPIHPVRLCDEIAGFMRRDAILVVDGQEILNYGRQSMPTFTPGHRLNSGPFGTMGVGLPFGLGAKIAKPDKQVIAGRSPLDQPRLQSLPH